MVKRIKVPVPPKGPGDERNSQSIYVNTRVKKLMGSWHPDYNPQLHKCKYLHGSVMMACGYRRWIVWWDDGFNWNKLYTGAGYHSSGLVKCDMDQQGFSDITPGQISDMTATIRGIVDDNVSGDDDEPEEDLPATGLASNKNKTRMQPLFIIIKSPLLQNKLLPRNGSSLTIHKTRITSFVFSKKVPQLLKSTINKSLLVNPTASDRLIAVSLLLKMSKKPSL